MKPAPIPRNESKRLAALRSYHILDTAAEQVYDDITQLAAYICKVPMATISLVDEDRQWFKSRLGIEDQQTPREIAFCAHTILQAEPMIVRDALLDERFADSPLVVLDPKIRFYAGFPLVDSDGYAVGSLCAIDGAPRDLAPEQKTAMAALARQVIVLLQMRRASRLLAEALEQVHELRQLLPICAWCKRVRDDQGYWRQVDAYIQEHSQIDFSHGICPDCAKKVAEPPAAEPLG